LRSLGVETETQPVGLDLGPLERRLAAAPDDTAVFNLVEALGGRAALIHIVPTVPAALGGPVPRRPAQAQHVSSNKLLAKARLAEAGLPTPERWSESSRGGAWIVKSVWEHASIGLDDESVVADAQNVATAIDRKRAESGGEWFAERFVRSEEPRVG